jgi:hypothetical protein
MKTLPYVWVYAPWTAMIICELALFLLIWLRPAKTRYRGFETYITFSTALSLVLLGISLSHNASAYFTAYYLGAFLKAISVALACYEQFKLLFFPRWSMSSRSLKILMGLLGMVVLGSIGLMMFTQQRAPVWDLAIARKFVFLSDFLLCGAMGLLLLYGEFLKVERPQRAQAIVRGLIATGILGVTSSLMLAVSNTRQLGGLVGFSTTIGFVCVLISWIVAFRKPEAATELDGTQESPLDGLAPSPATQAVVSHMLMWKI